jgi:hypothetical protein
VWRAAQLHTMFANRIVSELYRSLMEGSGRSSRARLKGRRRSLTPDNMRMACRELMRQLRRVLSYPYTRPRRPSRRVHPGGAPDCAEPHPTNVQRKVSGGATRYFDLGWRRGEIVVRAVDLVLSLERGTSDFSTDDCGLTEQGTIRRRVSKHAFLDCF